MTDCLNLLLCAEFSAKYMLSGTVRPLSRRQEVMVEHVWQVVSEFLVVKGESFCLQAQLTEFVTRRLSYVGEVVSVRRSIVAALVEPVWPVVGEAAACQITKHIAPHLASQLMDPRGRFRPVEDWPSQTPKPGVFVDDHEWCATVRAGCHRGMMTPVADDKI